MLLSICIYENHCNIGKSGGSPDRALRVALVPSQVLQYEELFIMYKERHATTVKIYTRNIFWPNLLMRSLEYHPKVIGLNFQGKDKTANFN